jgi:hypothetical protein
MVTTTEVHVDQRTHDSRSEGNGGNSDGSHVDFVSITTCTSSLTCHHDGGTKQYTQHGL